MAGSDAACVSPRGKSRRMKQSPEVNTFAKELKRKENEYAEAFLHTAVYAVKSQVSLWLSTFSMIKAGGSNTLAGTEVSYHSCGFRKCV